MYTLHIQLSPTVDSCGGVQLCYRSCGTQGFNVQDLQTPGLRPAQPRLQRVQHSSLPRQIYHSRFRFSPRYQLKKNKKNKMDE